MLWDRRMESGIAVIDHEHRELVERIGGLLDEPNPERIQEMLDFLRGYVIQHFAHEQLLHKNCRYVKAPEHKEVHKSFIYTFLQLEEECRNEGYSLETRQKVVDTVNAWLLDHIMGQDKEFAIYFKALPAEARPHA